ncbi:MAG: MMPL family transporter [Muribaculaceae bacterium]|nr:MMPL family transporter [Muribaculaceae bacterium]
MTKLVTAIYDFFSGHRAAAVALFALLTAALAWSVSTLSYKEDISDFLPLDKDNHTALAVYQDISGANRIYAIIGAADSTAEPDPALLAEAVEAFCSAVEELDTAGFVSGITKEIDMERMLSVADHIYDNIANYLTEADYRRIDSLLADPAYPARRLEEDKQMLLLPTAGVLGSNIARDPLNLFAPVLGRLSRTGMNIDYETFDGYIFSPDLSRAIVIMESAFGANESDHNAALVAMLSEAARRAEALCPGTDIHTIGGPVIAVGNASQIKHDSVLAVVIAGILILALLIYVFRNARNILLIVVSVGWGWLFAMGIIALFYSSVSIIVVGIASVILGIAVNYPLHLIDHLKDSARPRSALREIVSPLVIGNITTVGAFLCLVPLSSPALHDLGLFSSLLLVGTIFFVLVFLPHAVRTRRPGMKQTPEPRLITRLGAISIENSRTAVWVVIALTAVFAWFSMRTEFDSDMRNINFMTAEQRADFDYFGRIFANTSGTESVYVLSNGASWDEAMAQNELIDSTIDSLVAAGAARRTNAATAFLCSPAEQKRRIALWEDFLARHGEAIEKALSDDAPAAGFSTEAFAPFINILESEYTDRTFDPSDEFISTVFGTNLSTDGDRCTVVQTLLVQPDMVAEVKEAIKADPAFVSGLCFDVRSMNSAISNTLSDDFNYIGLACGCIVFIFLWLSLGSIELAMVSFLPMAVSWIWILGIMAMLGIKFNIVNIILATFIFGQGDDYTIFMTEGLTYEFAYRRKLLASYKNSIVVSALIMFIGIGTLVFAKHPALRSLGEVTVVGMLSVVLMAYLFPPLIFRWLVKSRGKLRYRPVTLKKVLCTAFCACVFFAQLLSGYVLGFFLFVLTRPTPAKRLFFHRYTTSVFRFDIKRMPGIHHSFANPGGESFNRPAMVVCNHQSILDSFVMMTVSPRIVLLAGGHVGRNPVIRIIFRWCGFLSADDGVELNTERIRSLVAEGYSVAVFPEGERPEKPGANRMKRFHRGAFRIADELGLDIVPVYLFGIDSIMPKGSALSNGGYMRIEVGKRIPIADLRAHADAMEQAKAVRKSFQAAYDSRWPAFATPAHLRDAVLDRFRYKGAHVFRAAHRRIRAIVADPAILEPYRQQDPIYVAETGQGELSLILCLMYPERKVHATVADPDIRELLEGAADGGFAPGLCVTLEKS